MQLFVGSTNPVKINAVITAASETWPDVQAVGMDVPSGVSEQPWGDEETRQGARNRAQAALDDGTAESEFSIDSCLGIGLEGGVMELFDEVWSTVWVSVVDATGSHYEANGARFKIPESIAAKLQDGVELGPLMNSLFQGDVRRTNGAIGIFTNNFVDRTEEYSAIAKLALGLWYGRKQSQELR